MNRFTRVAGLLGKVVLVSSSVTLLGAACWKGVGTNTNVGTGNAVANTNTAAGNENTEVNVNVSANTNTNTNSAGEIDTSDWLTYTNEEYGLTFQYPTNWNVKQEWLEKGSEGEKYNIFLQNQAKESILFFLTTKDFASEEGEGNDLYVIGEPLTSKIEDLKKRGLPIYASYKKQPELKTTYYIVTTYTETSLSLLTLLENQEKQYPFMSINSPGLSYWRDLEVDSSEINTAIKKFESGNLPNQQSNNEYLQIVRTIQY